MKVELGDQYVFGWVLHASFLSLSDLVLRQLLFLGLLSFLSPTFITSQCLSTNACLVAFELKILLFC